MKKYLLVFLILSIFISCKKGDMGPAGSTGPAGPAGPQGPQGVAGNANVTQYTYGSQNFVASGFVTLQATTTLDTMNKSAWFVYLYYQPNDRWYFIPGYAFGGSTQYRISMGYSANKVNIYIDRIGTGETYSQAKVVRVYTNTTATGGRPVAGTPPPDYSDYNAVKNYYHLDE